MFSTQPFHKAGTKAGTEGEPMIRTSPGRLTEAFIRSIKEPCKHGDGHGGHGLTLVVRDRAGGGLRFFWRQIFTIDGKTRSTGLGSYPLITLKEARYMAFDNARKIALGEDILAPKREIPTLAQAFEQYMANRTPEWKQKGERKAKETEDRWNLSKTYCLPILSKRVSDVDAEDVLNVFRPIWIPYPATANNVQSNLHQVMNWAIQMKYRTTNPANRSVMRSLGKQPPPEHHKAAPYQKLGGYLAKIRDSKYGWAPKYCIIFLAFTEDRSGEAREAEWSDIDWDKETLTIPAHRMKSGIKHVVPLPKQAMEILRFAWSKRHHSNDKIFPPPRGSTSLDRDALAEITRELDLKFVPHGLRSSFTDWVSENRPESETLSEMSLAHVVGTTTRRAYARSILLEPRRKLLQEYADYLTETMGPVIAGAPRPKGDPSPKIKSKDEPATRAEPPIAAVPGSDQPAGKPENGTTAATAGRTTKRRHPAPTLATVNRRAHKDKKQRIEALQKPLLLPLLPTKTRT